jgi:hypothetical protein
LDNFLDRLWVLAAGPVACVMAVKMKKLLWLLIPAYVFVDWLLPPAPFEFEHVAAAQTVSKGNPSPGPVGIVSANVAVCDPNNPTWCISPIAPSQNAGTGTTGAVSATLGALGTSVTNAICGFDVSAAGTGSVGPITISNLSGGTFTYQLTAPGTLSRTFTPCIQANSTNTPIAVTTTADGTATAVDVNIFGIGLVQR